MFLPSKISLKVRYAETDQMGVVYHGNYPQYMELARLDWLSGLGVSYKKMEEEGVILPVFQLDIKYLQSAFFDDDLIVQISLRKIPTVKIIFDYKIYNQNKELLTTASTTLVFVDKYTKKPIRCPEYLLEIIKNQA